ncbi:MAG: SigE family RNA polymerase sigma factor [Kineosporiaceae bacterium]
MGRGFEADFDDFVAARATALLRFATVMATDPADASRLLEQALTRAHLAWPRIHRAGDAEAHLRRLILAACSPVARWARPSSWLRGRSQGPLAGIDGDVVLASLRSLPVPERAAVLLRHYDRWDDHAIAAVLQVTPEAVPALTRQGMAALRAGLQVAEGGAPA